MTTTVASLQAIFGADTTQLDNAIGRVKGGLSGLGDQVGGTVERIGSGMQSAGAKIGLGIAPIAAIGAVGLKTASDFDSALGEISARTGLFGDDMAAIEAYALQMGAETAFSAQQSADAFLQLLTSGQSVEEAMATLPFVLDAAAASGAGLGESADLLTDIMAAYGLSVEQAEYVTNALAKASGASSADMASLGQGFANVGPVANMYGLSVERTAAALAALSENGIKGAEAGTALKSMLMNMTRPTEDVQGAWETLGVSFYDAQGNTRDLAVVLAELDASLNSGNFTVEEQNELIKTLGGSYGAAALQALMAGDSITAMELLMQDAATAEEVAAARMDTFAGTIDSLKGSVETLMIKTLRPFMDRTLKPLAQQATGLINAFADWAAEHPGLVRAVGLLVVGLSALSTVLIVGGGLVSFFGAALGFLLSPIGLVVAAVAGLALAVKTNFLGIGDFARGLVADVKTLFGDLKTAFEEGGLGGLLSTLWDKLKQGVIDAAGWLNEKVVTPIVNAVKNIDWAEVPGQIENILEKFAGVVVDIAAWVDTNLITPIVDELKLVDWAGVGNRLLDLLERFLGVAAAGITSIGVWVWDNIVSPVVSYLTNVNWSNTISRLGDLLERFLGVAAAGITSIGVWVWDNIVSPVVSYLGTVDWADVGSKLLDLLGKLLGAVGAGIESVGGWAFDNIIQPIVDKLGDPETWATVWTAAKDIGLQIFNGVIDGLAGIVEAVWNEIQGALPSKDDIKAAIMGKGGAGGEGGAGGGARGFGSAGGGPVLGGVPRVVGETGPELFVPPTSGQILTSRQLARAGAGGPQVMIVGGTFVLQGVQNVQQLFDDLKRIGERRA